MTDQENYSLHNSFKIEDTVASCKRSRNIFEESLWINRGTPEPQLPYTWRNLYNRTSEAIELRCPPRDLTAIKAPQN